MAHGRPFLKDKKEERSLRELKKPKEK